MPDPTLEWFGCTTFRLRVAGRTLWFDTYVDRPVGTEPVGITAADIDDAAFVFVSHAHFDHVLGADTVARNTGAPVVGSYETARVLAAVDVPASQLWPVSGGEAVDCGNDVRVRVLPSLHSCLFAPADLDAGVTCTGDLDVSYQERRARSDRLFDLLTGFLDDKFAARIETATSRLDGGQLNYLVEAPGLRVLVAASSGYWSGIVRDLRPDVAILAASGRGNVDGEPVQGSLADFVADEVALLRAGTVVLCHHDAWLPMLPPVDVSPIKRAISGRASHATVLDLSYAEPVRLRRT